MRLLWHIFKKDARRLWWLVAVTLGLLAWVAHLDRWRADPVPSSGEAWLNVLLPFAWSYLISLLILQDPLVGDREFWPTLPCRRPVMLGAKALFLLAFIHLPYFLAQAAILWARGFSPFAYLPHLLWKQCLLLAVLTLPAVAVAALVENVVQFLLIAVLTCAAVVLVNAYSGRAYLAIGVPADATGNLIALFLASSGAFAIMLLQYGWRRTALSRWLAIAAAVGASALCIWLSRASVAAAFSPPPVGGTLSVRLSPRQEPLTEFERNNLSAPGSIVRAAVPIEVAGVPGGAIVHYGQLALVIQAPGGESYRALPSPASYLQKVSLEASLAPWDSAARVPGPDVRPLALWPDRESNRYPEGQAHRGISPPRNAHADGHWRAVRHAWRGDLFHHQRGHTVGAGAIKRGLRVPVRDSLSHARDASGPEYRHGVDQWSCIRRLFRSLSEHLVALAAQSPRRVLLADHGGAVPAHGIAVDGPARSARQGEGGNRARTRNRLRHRGVRAARHHAE